MSKRIVIGGTVLAILLSAGCSLISDRGSQSSNGYPRRAITLIVPYSPGGATDRTSRILAKSASKYLPHEQSIVVENRPGGGSVVGLTALNEAEPDGYTLGVTMETGVATKPNTENVDYKWNGFTPIMMLTQSPQLLIVRKDAPWRTFEDLMKYIRQNPGEFKYGNSGVGSIGHLTMEALAAEKGLKMKAVPYGGGGESKQALLSGQTDADIGSPADVDKSINRPIVNLADTIKGTEDIPTLADFGIDTKVVPWIGLLAPPGTDKEVARTIREAFKKALEDDSTRKQLEKLYLSPYYRGPDEFAKIMKARHDEVKELVERLGMKKE